MYKRQGHGGAALVLSVLGLDEVRSDVAELLHEGVLLGEAPAFLRKRATSVIWYPRTEQGRGAADRNP